MPLYALFCSKACRRPALLCRPPAPVRAPASVGADELRVRMYLVQRGVSL